MTNNEVCLLDFLQEFAKESSQDEANFLFWQEEEISYWLMPEENLINFWHGYLPAVTNIWHPGIHQTAEEKSKEFIGEIIVNNSSLILQVYHKSDDFSKDIKFLSELCYLYQDHINDNYNITDEELIAVVLQSSNGYQLNFPNIICSEEEKIKIEEKIKDKIISQEPYQWSRDNRNYRPILGGYDDLFQDHLTLFQLWPRLDQQMLNSKEYYNDFIITDFFDVQYIEGCDSTIWDKYDLNILLPLYLSTLYYQNSSLFNKVTYINVNAEENIDLEDFTNAKLFLEMININRLHQQTYWLEIGQALFHASEQSELGLEVWIDITERAMKGRRRLPSFLSNSIEEICKRNYEMFTGKYITVKTLAWFAKEDNPEKYIKWHQNRVLETLEKLVTGDFSESLCAKAIYHNFWLEYAFHCHWYHYRNHRWNLDKFGTFTFHTILEKFEKIINAIISSIQEELVSKNISREEEDKILFLIDRFNHLLNKIGQHAKRVNIMAECRGNFYIYEIEKKLDSNPELTGVQNGVIDVRNETIIHRSGKPEDFISLNTNIPYVANLSWQHNRVKECMKLITQIFPIVNNRNYFLKYISSFFRSGNEDKLLLIWTGNGNNGKSIIVKLCEQTLGTYSAKLPVASLNDKSSNAGAASPHLARVANRRAVFLDEPHDGMEINKGVAKRLTGDDTLFVRRLYGDGDEMPMTFKSTLICNRIPSFSSRDYAIEERTRILDFISTWVNNPPEDPEECERLHLFKKDPKFSKKIPLLTTSFLWIMVQYYPVYLSDGLDITPEMKEITDKYWVENDLYVQFLQETTETVKNGEEYDCNYSLTISAIWTEFKVWFLDNYPSSRLPKRTNCYDNLRQRLGPYDNKHGWIGLRFSAREQKIKKDDIYGQIS